MRKLYSAFHRELIEKRGFAPKPVLLGRSRGGLMTLSWAVENPDKVGGFAGIYPVCNVESYPGVLQASGAYRLKPEELAAQLADHNPIDRLTGVGRLCDCECQEVVHGPGGGIRSSVNGYNVVA